MAHLADLMLRILQNLYNEVAGSFVTGVIGGIVIPIVLHALQQRRGMIAHEIVDISPDPTNSSISTIAWRIWNSGNETIEAAYYQRPIRFTFGPNAEILDFAISAERPAGMAIGHTYPNPSASTPKVNNLLFQPILLNKRDSITLAFRVEDAGPGPYSIDLRLARNKTIDMAQEREKLSKRATLFFAIMLVSCALWLIDFAIHFNQPQIPFLYTIEVSFAFLVFLFGGLSILNHIWSVASRK